MKRASLLLTLAASLLGAAATAPQEAAPAEVLRATAQYVSTYAARISGVTLQEEYTLLDVSGGRVVSTQRISSDVVLIDVNGRPTALRDPFAVDGNALRQRTPRITSLLSKPTQAAWDKAQEYASESLRYFRDEIIVRLNDPTLALWFVEPDNQRRATFKLDGKKKIEGIDTVGLAFQETKITTPSPGYVLTTPGRALARGRLWVEPATGRVLRTELSMQSNTETARVTVDYRRDAELDAFLPSAMVDTYEVSERTGASMSNMGAGSPGIARRSFECRATYAKVSHTPIDLRVVK
jgi:hypothetical protein